MGGVADGSRRLLVGYRDDDPRRYLLPGDVRGGVRAGRCLDCRHHVYLDPSGVACLRDRDPVVVCMWCQDHYRYRERVHPSGVVALL